MADITVILIGLQKGQDILHVLNGHLVFYFISMVSLVEM